MRFISQALAACMISGTVLGLSTAYSFGAAPFAHVLLISVDGLHAIDLANYVASHPSSTLALLTKTGIQYPNALTPARRIRSLACWPW